MCRGKTGQRSANDDVEGRAEDILRLLRSINQQAVSKPPAQESEIEPLSDAGVRAMKAIGRELSLKRAKSMAAVKSAFGGRAELQEAWRWCDKNSSNQASLAEVDSMIEQFVNYMPPGKFGGFFLSLNNKPAIMRAVEYTKYSESSSDGDDWISTREFAALLKNLHFFNELWRIFAAISKDGDRRISLEEFRRGLSELGLSLGEDTEEGEQLAEVVFWEIDRNQGGAILFDELCHFTMHAIDVAEGRMGMSEYEKKRASEIMHAEEMERRMGGGERGLGQFQRRGSFQQPARASGAVYPPKLPAPAQRKSRARVRGARGLLGSSGGG